jgi:hypothetical protein
MAGETVPVLADVDEKIEARARRIARAHGADANKMCKALRRVLQGLPSLKFLKVTSAIDDAAEFVSSAWVVLGRDCFDLIESTPLDLLERRVRMTRCLADEYDEDALPLISSQDLAEQLGSLATFLSSDRDYLLRTGLPSKQFPGSRWLGSRAARLYVTKRHDGTGPFDVPTYFGGDFTFYKWIQIKQGPEEPSPTKVHCRERDADLLPGITSVDAERLHVLRDTIFKIKLRVLAVAEQFLKSEAADDMWPKCLPIIREHLTSDDVEFCVRVDRLYDQIVLGWNNMDPNLWCDGGYEGPTEPGGLTSILTLIWHVQKERTIGTMHRTREALGDLVVDQEGRHLLSVRDKKWGYFEFVNRSTLEKLHQAIDIFCEFDGQEIYHRRDFERQVLSDLTKRQTQEEERINAPFPAQSSSRSPASDCPVCLGGPGGRVVIVKGDELSLTTAGYDVIRVLVEAYPKTLTKDKLTEQSGRSDAVNTLKRLAKKPDALGRVIKLAGKKGSGYGLRNPDRPA